MKWSKVERKRESGVNNDMGTIKGSKEKKPLIISVIKLKINSEIIKTMKKRIE